MKNGITGTSLGMPTRVRSKHVYDSSSLEPIQTPNFLCAYTSRRLLSVAAYGGHIECAQVLLVHGADPNGQDGSGDTPLFPAIKNCDAPMVQMLLEMRADPQYRE